MEQEDLQRKNLLDQFEEDQSELMQENADINVPIVPGEPALAKQSKVDAKSYMMCDSFVSQKRSSLAI